jgi:hypothetical protein
MSDTSNPFSHNFSKIVPGFDFLQNLASSAVKGVATNVPQLPSPTQWIAPTFNVEELEKRISELKTVQFWLDQNAKALAATVTALEVQKMTLATLKGMNFNMAEVANAFKPKAAESSAEPPTAGKKTSPKKTAASPGIIDPMQWWGALTQQFGQIAGDAMKDAAQQTAMDTTKNMAKVMTQTAVNTAFNKAGEMAQTAKRIAIKKVAAHAHKTSVKPKKR